MCHFARSQGATAGSTCDVDGMVDGLLSLRKRSSNGECACASTNQPTTLPLVHIYITHINPSVTPTTIFLPPGIQYSLTSLACERRHVTYLQYSTLLSQLRCLQLRSTIKKEGPLHRRSLPPLSRHTRHVQPREPLRGPRPALATSFATTSSLLSRSSPPRAPSPTLVQSRTQGIRQ